ncbi:MAG TPA: DNA-3-methyladenine glycosylase [Anaerolineales bacterium]|nr:DNA-3-methyladenine glycosylase [Anaerolineales bacterium]
MPAAIRLERPFFARPALQVARELLGARLVRLQDGLSISGFIVETEAYRGQEDLGCHCRAGRTPRTQVMYGPPGHAYVYFTYGMHWMLNFVVEPENQPAAILIRAILPDSGLDRIASRRGPQPAQHWTDGPAKLCQALSITGELNGADLCSSKAELFVETGEAISDSCVTIGPRVGLYTVPEPWKSIPWRFRAQGWQPHAAAD